MPDDIGALAEGTATVLARIGLLPGVDPAVLAEEGAAAEGPPTLTTLVQSLPRVAATFDGIRPLAEGLAALRTQTAFPVWILWCLMRLQLWLKAFPHSWHAYGFSPWCTC